MEFPAIGDIAHIKANSKSIHADTCGIVSRVEPRGDGGWTSVELLLAGERCWFDRDDIDQVLKERNPFKNEPLTGRTPCRIFAILARNAAIGAIFRRGPSKWVQLIRWNTDADTFAGGQWFHGRLYERRADLSPDGTKLIYFAAKISERTLRENRYSYAWTAISKPPYLTALALWSKQVSGTYFGGGLFITDTQVWLNHLACEAEAHPDHRPPDTLQVTVGTFDPRYEVGFYRRLQRDGWHVDPAWWERYAQLGFVGAPRAWHEKAHPRHAFRLVMESSVFYTSEPATFALQDDYRGELIAINGATWADWDHRGRLVYGAGGKLFAVEVSEQGVGDHLMLADFNSLRPAPREAPASAMRW